MSEEAADRYERVHRILGDALGFEGPQREAFLETACEDDPSILEEVRALLGECTDGIDDAFAESQVVQARRAIDELIDAPAVDWFPKSIGDYRILRKLGHGGMGVVYEAEQESPRRRVALKLMHPMNVTKERLKRFHQETHLLGRLQHPGIARIYEAGTYDVGRGTQPYFAMELVEGDDLRTHCETRGLDLDERLELLARTADAVQYAHEHGVIHRDLKPDNVLVDRHGAPRILDFGIARSETRSTDFSTIQTVDGQLVGTLAYMAPEQLDGSATTVQPVVDVFSLGVIGFELMCGQLPRLAQDLPLPEAIASLARSEAPLAGDLDSALRGDVEVILGKALESDVQRRYSSAAAFAKDLRRHLANQPILARAPSRIYLVRKFARRNRALVGGTLATLFVAIFGALLATSFAVEAMDRARDLERAGYIFAISAAQGAIEQEDFSMAVSLLEGTPHAHRGWEYEHLRARLAQDSEDWELPAAVITPPVVNHEQGRLLAGMANGEIGSWSLESGELMETWTLQTMAPRDEWMFDSVILHGPTSKFAACTSDRRLVIGRLRAGGIVEVLATLAIDAPRLFAWDASGSRLLYRDQGVCIWDGAESFRVSEERFGYGAFNRRGDRVVLASVTRLFMIDLETREVLRRAHLADVVTDLEFSPDDRLLAVPCRHRSMLLLDGETLAPRAEFIGHQDLISNAAWSPDGRHLVTASQDATARVWTLGKESAMRILNTGDSGYPLATFGIDSSEVLIGGNALRQFPLEPHSVLDTPETSLHRLAFSPDGTRLAASSYRDPAIYIWDVGSTQLLWEIEGPRVSRNPTDHFENVSFLAFSKDSRRLVAGSALQTLQWEVEGGVQLAVAEGSSPFEQFKRTLGSLDHLRIQDAKLAVHPDGDVLARGNSDGSVQFFACAPEALVALQTEGEPGRSSVGILSGSTPSLGRLVGHVGGIHSIEYSPDGTRVATGGNDGTVRLWDASTHELLLVLRGHNRYVQDLEFSPDGSLLASASGDRSVRLWDTLGVHDRRERSNRD